MRAVLPPSRRIRCLPLVAALQAACLGPALLHTAASHAQAGADARSYSVPAGPLAAGLDRLARTAGVNLSYDAALVQGLVTRGVNGTHGIASALAALLAGTGLEAVAHRDGGYAVRKAAPPLAVAAGRPSSVTMPATAPAVPGAAESALAAVTVLGSRDPAVPLSAVPASITVVPRAEIAVQQATAPRVEEILARTVPGFNPTSVGVRQIRGRTAQVFVNGVPTNEQLRASSGSDLNLLAPDQLDMIEVARGANSAYGFGSPGGIIALSTPRAESEQLTLKTRVGTSFNTSRTDGTFQSSVYQSVSRIVGDFDYHFAGSVRSDGIGRDPDGRPALDFNSPAMFSMGREELLDVDTSLGWQLTRTGSVRLTATAGHVDVRRHLETDGSGVYRGRPSRLVHVPEGDRSERRHHTMNLSYENSDIGGNTLKLEAFTSRVRELRYSPGVHQRQDNEYDGIRSAVTAPLKQWLPGASVTYGLDALRNRYFNPQFITATGAVERYWGPDTTLASIAPYAQVQLPVGDVRFNAGVRHERSRGRVESGASTSGAGDTAGGNVQPFALTLFNAGAVMALAPGRELYATFAQGAEVSQLSRAARNAGSAERIDPQPARSNQYELGLRQRDRTLDYGVSAFYTESDLMSALLCNLPAQPCTPLREPRSFWGLEGTAAWRIDARWGVGGTASWMDGRRTLPTGEKRRIGGDENPPLLLAAHADYSPAAGWKNRLQVDWRGSRDVFGDSTAYAEGRVRSVFLAHFTSSVAVGPGELRLGIRNLFDRRFFSIAAEAGNGGYLYVPEQGRRVSLSYAATW